MAFIRFVLAKRHPESGLHDGVFRVAYELCSDVDVSESDRRSLRELIDWFEKNPEMASLFSETMVGFHGREPAAVAAAYDFSKMKTIVDVGGATYALRATLPADTTTYKDATARRTVYWYRVRAFNVDGPSAYSAPAVTTTK